MEIGIQKMHSSLCMAGKRNKSGMLVDVQVSWHNSTAHAWKFFPPKVQKQTTVLSFDDVTDILLKYLGVRYKKEACTRPGEVWFSCSFFWYSVCFSWLVSQLVHLGSHRPSNLAMLVPLKECNYNQIGKCSLFVQMYILKNILGMLSLCALVVCKLAG